MVIEEAFDRLTRVSQGLWVRSGRLGRKDARGNDGVESETGCLVGMCFWQPDLRSARAGLVERQVGV